MPQNCEKDRGKKAVCNNGGGVLVYTKRHMEVYWYTPKDSASTLVILANIVHTYIIWLKGIDIMTPFKPEEVRIIQSGRFCLGLSVMSLESPVHNILCHTEDLQQQQFKRTISRVHNADFMSCLYLGNHHFEKLFKNAINFVCSKLI